MPQPFEEPLEHFWPDNEPFNDLIPRGWLSDFIYMTRGVETPTKLSLWTALWVISTALKRQTWLEWYPFSFFGNLFVFLVGPPRILAKTTSARFGDAILSKFHLRYKDMEERLLREVTILHSKATPEGLSMVLRPTTRTGVGPDQRVYKVDVGSEVALILGELSVFLGKQKYNTGLIDHLTNLYDCLEKDDDTTVSRGIMRLENTYVTIIGATTPSHLESSIPEEAFGSGFMSRINVVYQEHSTREYPFPKKVLGAPTLEEMEKRLAYIVYKSKGQMSFSQEAKDYYEKWYYAFRRNLERDIHHDKSKLKFRYDVHLLKLAMLVRVQRYDPGMTIELTDLLTAEKILDATYSNSYESIQNVGMTPYNSVLNRVKKLTAEKKKITRRQLLLSVSPYGCTADQLTKFTDQLSDSGILEIRLDGKTKHTSSRAGREVYVYKGDKDGRRKAPPKDQGDEIDIGTPPRDDEPAED